MRPGEYPLCSGQSRAEVRSLLASRKRAKGVLIRPEEIGSSAPPDTKWICPITSAGDLALCKYYFETK